jgi:hypothetical protein
LKASLDEKIKKDTFKVIKDLSHDNAKLRIKIIELKKKI